MTAAKDTSYLHQFGQTLGISLIILVLFGLLICTAADIPIHIGGLALSAFLMSIYCLCALKLRRDSLYQTAFSILIAAAAGLLIACLSVEQYREELHTALVRSAVALPIATIVNILWKRFFRERCTAASIILNMRHVLYITLLPLFVAVLLNSFYNCTRPVADPSDYLYDVENKTDLPSVKLKDNWEQLSVLLDNGAWESLSEEEQLDVLSTVLSIERTYLGLPAELHLEAVSPDDDNLHGYYNHQSATVSINRSILAYPLECLVTVCHEARHSYQHYVVSLYQSTDPQYRDLLLLYDAPDFLYELNNYIDADTDPQGYHSQKLEQDAEDYAYDSLYDYVSQILGYMKEAGIETDYNQYAEF